MSFYETTFKNENNVYQDGTVPFFRDIDGSLWAMVGHSHMGEICVFKGTTLKDMKKAYPITTNFEIGHADVAFDKVKYPEGIKARGSIWPFGLYICPKTHRFFCFFIMNRDGMDTALAMMNAAFVKRHIMILILDTLV